MIGLQMKSITLYLLVSALEFSLLQPVCSQIGGECEDLGTNHYCFAATKGLVRFTKMPNYLGHHSVEEANDVFHGTMFDRHAFNCSNLVDVFVCSLYFPVCRNRTEGGGVQDYHPCRKLCIDVAEKECKKDFADAADFLASHNIPAPTINCSVLPTFSSLGGACVYSDGITSPTPTVMSTTTKPVCSESCGNGLVSALGSEFGGISNCTEPCKGGFASPEEKVFIWAWLGVISIACLLFSLFIVTNWIVSYRSYRYPETPILHVSICYIFIALSYFIHVCYGPDIVCYTTDSGSGIASGHNTISVCSLTFFLLYFFSVASWMWWVAIVVLWFLHSAVQVNRSTLEQPILRVVYHLASWFIAIIFTVVAMATYSFGGNSVTRMCQITTQKSGAQIGFILAPQLLAIFICIVLLLFGHIWMLMCDSNRGAASIQNNRSGNSSANKKERSMFDIIRTDIFCVIFLVHLTVAAAVNMYQYQSVEKWERFYVHCTVCNTCSDVEEAKPLVGVFVFKVTVELLMGIVLVLWLKPKKIIRGWRRIYRRFKAEKAEESSSTTTTEPRTPSTPTTPTWSPTSV